MWCMLLVVAATTLVRAAETSLTRAEAFARAVALQALGQKIFLDPSLSAPQSR
jgi:cytochrome c peroxidase